MAIAPSSSSTMFTPTFNTTSFKQITCLYNGKHQSSFFDLKRCNKEASRNIFGEYGSKLLALGEQRKISGRDRQYDS